MKHGFWLGCCLGLLGLVACKVKPKEAQGKAQEMWRSLDWPQDSLWPTMPHWQWFEGRFDLSLDMGEESHRVKGRVRMQQDSSVLINLRPSIGIMDIARLWVRPDSVFFLDLINNEAYLGRTDTFPVGLGDLQAMMLGFSVPMYPPSAYQADMDQGGRIRTYSEGALAMIAEPGLVLPAQYVILHSNKQLQKVELGRPEMQMRIGSEPNGFSFVQGFAVAMENRIFWRAKGKPGQAILQFSKVEIGKASSLQLSIPAHFPRKGIHEISF